MWICTQEAVNTSEEQVKSNDPSQRSHAKRGKSCHSRKQPGQVSPAAEVDTRDPVMLDQHMLALDMGVWSMHLSQVSPGTQDSVSSPLVLPRSVLLSLGARQPPGSKRESGTSSSDMLSWGYLLHL